jgi:hypothetical protein
VGYGECHECGGDIDAVVEYSRINYASHTWVTEKFCSRSCRSKWLDRHPYIFPRLDIRVERGTRRENANY